MGPIAHPHSSPLHDGAPRYRQIHSYLKSLIASGKYLPGERLPTEKAISEQFAVSRHTARCVLQLLTHEGLVIRRQGAGSFVAPLLAKGGPSPAGVRLRLGAIYPPESFIVKSQTRFARRMAELTRNQVCVDVVPSSRIGSDTEQLAMLRSGELEMFGAAADWLEKLDPVYGITNIPFLFRDLAHVRDFVESPIAADLRDRVRVKCGVRVLADNWLRPSRVLIAKRPCMAVEDLAGLRLRVPPIPSYHRHWEALGAVPVPSAFRDIRRCLETGEVDAADVPRDAIRDGGLHRLARYITHTHHLYSRACLLIGEASFQSLRKDLQAALLQVSTEVGRDYSDQTLHLWSDDKAKMIRQGAVFIQTDIEPFRRLTRPLAASILGARTRSFRMHRKIFEMG